MFHCPEISNINENNEKIINNEHEISKLIILSQQIQGNIGENYSGTLGTGRKRLNGPKDTYQKDQKDHWIYNPNKKMPGGSWKRKSYYNISKGTKFQDYCIDYLYSIGKC